MFKKLAQANINLFRRSNKNAIKNTVQKRSSATSSSSSSAEGRLHGTGWTYESPNLAQYTALRGAMISICLRGIYVWNLAMLIAEVYVEFITMVV